MANRHGTAAVHGARGLDASRDITLHNVVITADQWTADSEYDDFPFQCVLPVDGVTIKMTPEITFDVNEVVSGNFAPIADTVDGGVRVLAASRPEYTITIPTIIVWK